MKIQSNHYYLAGGIVIGTVALFLLFRNRKPYTDLSLFDSPDSPGSGSNMKASFLKRLRQAEKYAGFTFQFNSAFRTPAYNSSVGGVTDSAHTKGQAVDIKASTIAIRDRIVWAARKAGFTRIGIASNFVHVDDDTTKPQYVAWGYPVGSKAPFNPF